MEPVVYRFTVNERGTAATLATGEDALMPAEYYTIAVPPLVRTEARLLSPARRAELDRFAAACHSQPEFGGMVQQLFDHLLPRGPERAAGGADSLEALLRAHGFDAVQHQQIQSDLRAGRIGLAQNRLPANTDIQDVRPGDVADARGLADHYRQTGIEALAEGRVAVVSLAGGAGSRWTKGAGVVKALNPFCRLGGRHRSFVEVHLAKSLRTGRETGSLAPHVFTTSYLTHEAIAAHLQACGNYGYPGTVLLSPGRSVGLRMMPMERDLRFAWEEMPQQLLDEQAQKVRESLRHALIQWARAAGEGSDYTDNLPLQCLHPVGHWYEVSNLLRNGVLRRLLEERPRLNYLMVHNIDTTGANLDAALLGYHIEEGAALTAEVIARELEDRGGGLARVNGHVRLVEGMALPDEEIECAAFLLQQRDVLAGRGPSAGGVRPRSRRPGRRGNTGARHTPPGRPHADVHHVEGCEEALGQGPGGCLPGGAVREAVGRHDGSARSGLPLRARAAGARTATEGPRAVGWVAAGRVGRVCRGAVRVVVHERHFPSP